MPNTIAFIDEDPAQRSLFFNIFRNEFNVEAIDPTNYDSSEEIMDDVKEMDIDLLIIDYQMMPRFHVNWTEIIKIFRLKNPFFPILLASAFVPQALDEVDDPNITCHKNIWLQWGQPLADFIKRINKLIVHYQEKKINSINELETLNHKRQESAGLSTDEENRYVELNKYVEAVLWSWDNPSARQFYSINTNQKIDELIEITEDLLLKL